MCYSKSGLLITCPQSWTPVHRLHRAQLSLQSTPSAAQVWSSVELMLAGSQFYRQTVLYGNGCACLVHSETLQHPFRFHPELILNPCMFRSHKIWFHWGSIQSLFGTHSEFIQYPYRIRSICLHNSLRLLFRNIQDTTRTYQELVRKPSSTQAELIQHPFRIHYKLVNDLCRTHSKCMHASFTIQFERCRINSFGIRSEHIMHNSFITYTWRNIAQSKPIRNFK